MIPIREFDYMVFWLLLLFGKGSIITSLDVSLFGRLDGAQDHPQTFREQLVEALNLFAWVPFLRRAAPRHCEQDLLHMRG